MAEQLICNQQVDGSTPFTSSIFYGGIPERPKGADCKSVVTDFAGPNPASPTIEKDQPLWLVFFYAWGSHWIRGRHLQGKCAGSHLSESHRQACLSGAKRKIFAKRIPSFLYTNPCGWSFFIQTAGLAYHHASACISSALWAVYHHSSECIFLRFDDMHFLRK